MARPTFNALISHLTYFLTVAFHTILAERHCYPSNSFITARAYNLPVKQSRHPDVCAWIQDAIAAIHAELIKGTAARVVLAIASLDSEQILERYVFDLTRLPKVPKEEIDTPIIWESPGARNSDSSGYPANENTGQKKEQDPAAPGGPHEHDLVDLTEQLRGALASISVGRRRLRPIPEGCPFTVAIELKDEADPPIGHPQPWVPVQPNLQRMKGGHRSGENVDDQVEAQETNLGKDLGGQRTVPMRAVEAEGLGFELWVEEGAAKGEG
ncbi:MAG: hypothetical protein Q9159_002352 [Coniocarpon cinnabarinum]